MAIYNTEQKKALVEFLNRHKDEAFSADEIDEKMKEELGERAPGKSTVYRLLPKLLEEGMVKRFEKNNKHQFLYQIVGGESCHSHLHLKCIGCGKLLHMSEAASQAVLNDVFKANDFSIDKEKTVLFGICSQCEKNKDKDQ